MNRTAKGRTSSFSFSSLKENHFMSWFMSFLPNRIQNCAAAATETRAFSAIDFLRFIPNQFVENTAVFRQITFRLDDARKMWITSTCRGSNRGEVLLRLPGEGEGRNWRLVSSGGIQFSQYPEGAADNVMLIVAYVNSGNWLLAHRKRATERAMCWCIEIRDSQRMEDKLFP